MNDALVYCGIRVRAHPYKNMVDQTEKFTSDSDNVASQLFKWVYTSVYLKDLANSHSNTWYCYYCTIRVMAPLFKFYFG